MAIMDWHTRKVLSWRITEARHRTGEWLDFYNKHRPYASLRGLTPDMVYSGMPAIAA